MSDNANRLVKKLWSYCNLLRDDGLSYQDYLEQLTYLLFLKMADERSELRGEEQPIPRGYRWADLADPQMEGERLEAHYRATLEKLARPKGMLGLIFGKAQNRIQDPAKLRRLIVELIGRENWYVIQSDIKGEAYEGLLERNARDTKSGAGQYFTPRPLIEAMVECVRPRPGEVIMDPACGTGGFLLAAHDYIASHYDMDEDEKKHLRYEALQGIELVDGVARLCAMNLFLHNIGDPAGIHRPNIQVDDALRDEPSYLVDVVLSNPPFGKKSSITIVNEEEQGDDEDEDEDDKTNGTREKKQAIVYNRSDFWTTTTNKQLNFLQHIKSLLRLDGRAAVVLPDNVLFEGGAGEKVRTKLLETCNVHTLLRLPTGIFYAQGVKANVLFFDVCPPGDSPRTTALWVYDLRTNKHFTLKQKPLTRADLDEFVACYLAEDRRKVSALWSEDNPEGRWRPYGYEELVARDKKSLDLFWLRDESLEDSDNLPDPDVLAAEIADDLRAALGEIEDVLSDLRAKAVVQPSAARANADGQVEPVSAQE